MYAYQVLGQQLQGFVSPKVQFLAFFWWPNMNTGRDQGTTIFSNYHLWTFFFSLLHKEEEVWPGGTHPMLLPESSCVWMPSFRSVAPFIF